MPDGTVFNINTRCVGDVIGSLGFGAEFCEVIGVTGVVTADDDHHVERFLHEVDDGVLAFLSCGTDGVETSEVIGEVLITVSSGHGFSNPRGNGERFVGEHGGLICNTYT